MAVPLKKTEITGIVVNQNKECMIVRADDNSEHSLCGIDTQAGTGVEVIVREPIVSWLGIEYYELMVVRNADELSDTVLSMSLEEKLGQMMVVRTQENLKRELDFKPGGYILFGNDFSNLNEAEIIEMTNELRKSGSLVMVDEEGGKVARVSKALYQEGYPSIQELYRSGGWEAVEQNLIEKSKLLKSLGIDVNLNPVADVCEDERAFIYPRSFGQNAQMTADYVRLAVKIQNQEDLVSCLKHFPGYGNNLDTHTGLSVDGRQLSDYRTRDFLPFQAGIEENAQMMMTSHIIMSAVDDTRPVSLSKKAIDILKSELNYSGIIITDDLTMDAIGGITDDPLTEALLAGNDLLLTTDPEVSIQPLVDAAEKGLISMNQVDESVLKILKLKQEMGIFGNLCENLK